MRKDTFVGRSFDDLERLARWRGDICGISGTAVLPGGLRADGRAHDSACAEHAHDWARVEHPGRLG